MPAETIRHLHLVHPAETSLRSKREQHNLIRLRIVSVGFEVWRNIHGPNAQRYKIQACLSNFAVFASDDDKQVASVPYSVKKRAKVTRSHNGIYENRFVGKDRSLPVRALIDPGFIHPFITADVCEQLFLPIQLTNTKYCLAKGEEFPVLGV